MILIDAGVLIALIDRRDAHHSRCVAAIKSLPNTTLATTWVCFTEAMHLLAATGGFPYQSELWRFRSLSQLAFLEHTEPDIHRMEELMAKYRDTPMDLADATLIASAESRGIRQILSLDSDFHIYRLHDGSMLQILPG